MATTFAYSQNVSFNSSGTTPNTSAVLDLSGCTNGGFLIPNVTNADIITAGGRLLPANLLATSTSLLVYNTTNNCFYSYYGTSASWVSVYCPCGGVPTTPVTPVGKTTSGSGLTAGTNTTYSVTAIAGATSYTWTLPSGWVVVSGGTTNSITVTPGCSTGSITVTASNSCGTSAASSLTIVSITSPASISVVASPTIVCSGSTTTLTASGAGGGPYTWAPAATLSASTGSFVTATPTVAAGGGTITYTATTTGCGALTANTTVSINTALSAPTVTGSSSISINSTNNAYSVPSLTTNGPGTYAWTVSSASLGTITAGAATNACSVTAASSASTTYSMQITEGNACGNAPATTYPVTVTACASPTITVDAASETEGGIGLTPSGPGTATFNMTTAGTNELVIISISGWSNSSWPNTHAGDNQGTISVNQGIGAPTLYDTLTNPLACVAVYWFVAPTAKTYTISITNATWQNYMDYFAVALKGFCGTPSAADFIAENKATVTGGNYSTVDATLVETAHSYAIACVSTGVSSSVDHDPAYFTSTGGCCAFPDWQIGDDDAHTEAQYGIAGQAITAAGTQDIFDNECSCGTTRHFKDAALIVIDIK